MQNYKKMRFSLINFSKGRFNLIWSLKFIMSSQQQKKQDTDYRLSTESSGKVKSLKDTPQES